MKLLTLLLLSLWTGVILHAATPTERIALWPGKAPNGDGTFEACDKELEVFLPPADKASGAAVVICPGGGYIRHVTDREGYPTAQWLNEHGIAAIILEYRLPKLRHQVPLLDAGRAIRLTRAHAAKWRIDPQRVGILGFSAGGHVASTATTHFDDGNASSQDPVERMSSRPGFAWLVYPVVTMGRFTHAGSRMELLGASPTPELERLYSNETQVTSRTPPVFLAHAIDDKPVPVENSRQFVEAMHKHQVPVELLELPEGGHGLNGCKGPLWEQWKAAALQWLSKKKSYPEFEYLMPPVRLLAALLATIALSNAPAAEASAAVKQNEVIFRSTLDNTEQRYVELVPVVRPEGRPIDLIIALHGHGSDRWQFIRDPRGECRGVRDAAARHHAILLAPDYRARTSWMGPQAEADLLQIIAEARRRHHLGRVFITGGSMGGTSALIFTALHPELIDGVCSLNGTANMLEFDGFQEAVSASYGGTRQSKPEEYRKRSAELHPEKFTMPVAITTGGKDAVVPPQSALRLAEALRQAGRKTLLIHRPEGGHSTSYEDTVRAMEFILRPASH